MNINDLLDMRKVAELIADGYLRERLHPLYPALRILGYTEKAQWERVWTHETTTCRGLIYDAATGEVLARPWAKFFNHGEHNQEGRPALDLKAEVEVSDKMDGSLGIIFDNPYSGQWEIATRGSFDSDQARKANAEFMPKLLETWTPFIDVTTLVEIIYPDNRIVLDYGDYEGLVLLGGVDMETGKTYGPRFDDKWPGKRADLFWPTHLTDALQMPPRPNAEGLVVRYVESGLMVKIKQEDYVRLHKIITGLSDKAVWEHLSEHQGDFSEMIEVVPDEFHEWLQKTAGSFLDAFWEIHDHADREFATVLDWLGVPPGVWVSKSNVDRALFARYAKDTKRPHLMFQKLDGRSLHEAIWKELRPKGVRYMSGAAVAEALTNG